MLTFAIKRIMQSVVVLFVMSLIVFSMVNLIGDPVDMLVNPESLPEEIDRVRQDFGLDQPVHIQYWKFLAGRCRETWEIHLFSEDLL
jgi:peptide/nickel transport system permease protein